MTYRVLSPDNIDIAPCTYKDWREAHMALMKWIKNYTAQGYYSQTCYNGYVRRITLTDLPDYCSIIPV